MKNPYVAEKVLYHPSRVSAFLNDNPFPPIVMEIDATNVCNLKCPWCVGGRTNAKASLSASTVLRVLHEMKDMGVLAVIFSGGGDPLCHPKLHEFTSMAHRLGFKVGLITNGILLDPDRRRALLESCDFIRISLDAWDAASYLYTHGRDCFDKVVVNTRALASERTHPDECNVCVGYLVDTETLKGMADAAQLAHGLGVDFIQFRPYYHALKCPELLPKIQDAYLAAKRHEQNGFFVYWSEQKYRILVENNGRPDRPYDKCYGHQFAGVVGADGEVYLCCHMRGQRMYSFGNVRDPFKAIWNGPQRQAAIAHIDLEKCPPLCRCDSMNRTLWNLKNNPETVSPFV